MEEYTQILLISLRYNTEKETWHKENVCSLTDMFKGEINQASSKFMAVIFKTIFILTITIL